MFIEFETYFINRAKVDFIGAVAEDPDTGIWDMFIYMENLETQETLPGGPGEPTQPGI